MPPSKLESKPRKRKARAAENKDFDMGVRPFETQGGEEGSPEREPRQMQQAAQPGRRGGKEGLRRRGGGGERQRQNCTEILASVWAELVTV